MNVWRSRPPSAAPVEAAATAAPAALGAPAGDGAAPEPSVPQPGEMPFLDHLEALRWHILKALSAVLVAVAVCLFRADWVVDTLLLAHTRADFFMYRVLGVDAVNVVLQNRTITGQFFAYFGTVLAVGLVVGSPAIVYQIWKFVEPGLYPQERRGLRFASAFATFFFVSGISFGYLVVAPFALQFFAQFTVSDQILNEFDISRYFSMLLTWTFGAGLLFELPVVVVALAHLGVVTEATLKKSRRIAGVVILVLAAVFTPPDPLSQLILAVPMVGLYELSIWLTRVVERRRARADALAALATPVPEGTPLPVEPLGLPRSESGQAALPAEPPPGV